MRGEEKGGVEGERQADPQTGDRKYPKSKTGGGWEKPVKLERKENGNPGLGSEDHLILLALRSNNSNNH